MRAIDADGVSEILTRVIEEQKKSHHVDEVIGLMEAKTEVNNAPTLDVQPVVHAHVLSNNGKELDSEVRNTMDGQLAAMSRYREQLEYRIEKGWY